MGNFTVSINNNKILVTLSKRVHGSQRKIMLPKYIDLHSCIFLEICDTFDL